jgi:hypothetical protein
MNYVDGSWHLVGPRGFSVLADAAYPSLAFDGSGDLFVGYGDGGAVPRAMGFR